jgi:hypothetical protein
MSKECGTNGVKKSACKLLVGKPERTRPSGRPKHRWVYIIKLDLRDSDWGGMDWIDLSQDRDPVEGDCEYCNEP